jgi:4-hydroxy-3-methylbut-2-enyl diphosphate reductase
MQSLSRAAVLIAWLCSLEVILSLQHGIHTKPLRASRLRASTAVETEKGFNPRDERRRILKNENYNRMGFKEEKKAVEAMMKQEFSSSLIQELRANNNTMTRGDLTVHLAEYYGFCWGVERSIAMAYEARAHFSDKTIHITNEIIHNPQVNDRLHEMDIKFLEPSDKVTSSQGVSKNYESVGDGDVVILPAFGATIEELQLLDKKGVSIVDTTCPWVSKVWNAVDAHRKAGQTSVIHGKYAHEETIATASFCDDYIIVKDLEEAQLLADYITQAPTALNKEDFLRKFRNAVSKGFDPDKHLVKVGLANQTTMYKRETKEIGRMLEVAMLKRYGPAVLNEHYAEFDTICDATQERQDAVTDLVHHYSKDTSPIANPLDFVLVVGGLDSSNTAHLKEIPEKYGVPAFHIDRADRISPDNTIEHREANGHLVKQTGFLRKGPMRIGITSGASTPDRCVEEALESVFMLHKLLSSSSQQ